MTIADEVPAGATPSTKVVDSDRLKKLNNNSELSGFQETLPYDVIKKIDKSARHRCLWGMRDPSSARSIPRHRTCWEIQLKNGESRRCMLDLEPVTYEQLPDG
jgi:hypothetical protein